MGLMNTGRTRRLCGVQMKGVLPRKDSFKGSFKLFLYRVEWVYWVLAHRKYLSHFFHSKHFYHYLFALTPGLTGSMEFQVENVIIVTSNVEKKTWKKPHAYNQARKTIKWVTIKQRGIRCIACGCDVYFCCCCFKERFLIPVRLVFKLSLFISAPRFPVWLPLHNCDLSHEPSPWWQQPENRKAWKS